MQCAACGHNDKPTTEKIEVLFKRGPRRGQVKSIVESPVPQFQELFVLVNRTPVPFEVHYREDDCVRDYIRADLYACPMCNTVRIG